MAVRRMVTMDGNEAVASVAHRINEVIAIYPITPSSNMGEWADEWSAKGQKNIWGTVPSVTEMQSEGGAAGAVHGALQAGALTTTFTASQGLLLMIPNMYKIAGELTAMCMHVSARTLATHALSIFGDHSDVMAVRQTGYGLLSSASVQEAHDFAVIAQRASMRSRIPFLHFFDGFRTSHEVAKVEELTDDDLRQMITEDLVAAHRSRALSPDRPVLRGTAQNPDAFFQAREAINSYYAVAADHVQEAMDLFAKITGRAYRLFEYHGHPQAERVVVAMGSGCETAHETIDALVAQGEKVGLVKVRLYRPFDLGAFMTSLPRSVQQIAVLDRTKEPGSLGEPLYMDVVTALREAEQAHIDRFHHQLTVIGGRYGLSSKEFTPAMVKAVFDELGKPRPKRHFTVGINDDVTHTSLKYDPAFDTEPKDVVRGALLRPRRGRHRRREQELDQDHRRGHAQLRPGLLRLRLEEVGHAHRLAPALRAAPDPLGLPRDQGELRRLPPGELRREVRDARVGRARRDVPAQLAHGAGRRLGQAPARGPAADPRQEAQVLRDRRLQGREGHRHGGAHQHHHADLLLRHLRRAAARRGDPPHQEDDREDLRPQGRRGRAEELRRGRPHPRPPLRGEDRGQEGDRRRRARRPCPRRPPTS